MLFDSRRALSLFRTGHMKCSAAQCPSVGLVRHALSPYAVSAACIALVSYLGVVWLIVSVLYPCQGGLLVMRLSIVCMCLYVCACACAGVLCCAFRAFITSASERICQGTRVPVRLNKCWSFVCFVLCHRCLQASCLCCYTMLRPCRAGLAV